jgi:hypothetical protein
LRTLPSGMAEVTSFLRFGVRFLKSG